MPSVAHSPIASMMSVGHPTARNRSLRLCRKEWIKQPLGTRGFNHLFNAALAEFELHFWSLQYLGNTNPDGDEAILLAAQSEKPINGICRWLDAVLSLRQGCSFKSTNGVAVSKWMSDVRSPQASERRIPVSLIKLINQRASSSRFWQSSCTRWIASVGIGFLCCFAPSSGMNVPLKTLVTVSPCSLIATLTIDLTEENTPLTD